MIVHGKSSIETAGNGFRNGFTSSDLRQAEARFIRGHFYFLLKVLFKYPVWFDENFPKEELKSLGNREYTNDQLWDKIAEDFQFAIDNLPEDQPEVGRANAISAKAYLAKVRLYQAYEQNEQHADRKSVV